MGCGCGGSKYQPPEVQLGQRAKTKMRKTPAVKTNTDKGYHWNGPAAKKTEN